MSNIIHKFRHWKCRASCSSNMFDFNNGRVRLSQPYCQEHSCRAHNLASLLWVIYHYKECLCLCVIQSNLVNIVLSFFAKGFKHLLLQREFVFVLNFLLLPIILLIHHATPITHPFNCQCGTLSLVISRQLITPCLDTTRQVVLPLLIIPLTWWYYDPQLNKSRNAH